MCSGGFGEVGTQNLEAGLGQEEVRMVWMWCGAEARTCLYWLQGSLECSAIATKRLSDMLATQLQKWVGSVGIT
jgi:hypothetical protein